ncbi:peptidoglycan-binding protein [Kovacikia minuta CCNUW1]|uniref:peptidoglycan-binding domain-containing protein n=1 Tax=Kovacikia minuta TaxID=2931930 RepID=UPI001CCAE90C|nr:peptidoglycan-binding domain-containing protein [Kovacikia minuta]UBF25813.1 peptidoglycan-binding protein [Kovacikia minuta CCNUW1]
MITYQNADIRSILNGLGYRSRLNTNDPDFPVSLDNSDLTDAPTQKALMKFQVDYNLPITGIADDATLLAMQEEINVLHNELNQLLGTTIPLDQPFYGDQTIAAIKQFQNYTVNGAYVTIDGLASFPLREELYTTLNPEVPVAV